MYDTPERGHTRIKKKKNMNTQAEPLFIILTIFFLIFYKII